MRVEIEGYRNIRNLKYEIVEKRINLLFGVSGSGKSSIAMAMCADDLEYNKNVSFSGDTKVLVDGEISNSENVMIFNSDSVGKYLTTSDESVFSILVDDENELNKEQNRFDKYMLRFRSAIDSYKSQYEQLKDLTSELVGTLTNKDELRSTSKIKQLEKNFSGKKNSRIVNEVNVMEDKKLEWIILGKSHIENHKCPFCLKKLSKTRYRKIVMYSEFDTKNLKIVREKSSQFSSLGITIPIYTSIGLTRLSNEMRKIAVAVSEFGRVRNFIENIDSFKDLDSINEIIVKDELYDYFPNLKRIVVGINKNISNINEKTIELNRKTKIVLSGKIKAINEKIEVLGIPYQIEIQYKKNKIKSYKLKLLNDLLEEDRKKSLSNGERNLIAFLIFALDVSKNGDNKLCIIDDPVSSYDEHRRKLIYDFIKEILVNHTVLILSHDSVFARIAANDKPKLEVGSINYFENIDGNVEFIDITNDDFNKFDYFLSERIYNSIDYYQRIINLRMLYEGNRGYIYSYLSKIIHFKSQESIKLWIESKGKSEAEILERIKNEKGILLSEFDDVFVNHLDVTNYSLIEKAALVRENIDSSKSSFRNELNHIMHVNDRQLICLNPHKYSFCSGSTRKEISKQIDKLLEKQDRNLIVI